MSKEDFDHLFIKELSALYDAEKQLIEALPKAINSAYSPDLKKAFEQHLQETKHQVVRLEKIFSNLNKQPRHERCEAMQGLIKELNKILVEFPSSSIRDAALIGAAQSIEHYEIAGYGIASTFANQLEYEKEEELLNESLEEESKADQKLTSIAEGGIFSTGINEKAAIG